jgi:uncharacterized ion transporter superfamily protein YfcC
MASTINPFMIGAAAGAADDFTNADISMGLGMGFRFISFFILAGITISAVTFYA